MQHWGVSCRICICSAGGIASRTNRTTHETMQDDSLSKAHDLLRAYMDNTVTRIIQELPEQYELQTQEDAQGALHEQLEGHEDVIYTYRARLIASQIADEIDDMGLQVDPGDPMHHSTLAYLVLSALALESPAWDNLVDALDRCETQ